MSRATGVRPTVHPGPDGKCIQVHRYRHEYTVVMINLLQVNLGGGSAAQSLMMQSTTERQADIIIISEFYKSEKSHEQWYCDSSNRSAVAVLSNLTVDET